MAVRAQRQVTQRVRVPARRAEGDEAAGQDEVIEVRLPEMTDEEAERVGRILRAWLEEQIRSEHGISLEDYDANIEWDEVGQMASLCGIPGRVVDRAIARGELRVKQTGPLRWARGDLFMRWVWALDVGRAGAGQVNVYFVADGDRIKIGQSRNPAADRLGDLATGNPRPLRLLGVMRGTDETEGALHRRFDYLRGRGEWFRAAPELLAFIAEHASPSE